MRTVCQGAHGAKLKLIAREGKGRSAVAVGIIEQNLWNLTHHIELKVRFLLGRQLAAVEFLEFVQHFGQLAANKHRNNCRWGLVGSQAVVVAGRGNCRSN